jgi:hypothetical protein
LPSGRSPRRLSENKTLERAAPYLSSETFKNS